MGILLVILLVGCTTHQPQASETDEGPLTISVLSDVHYTQNPTVSESSIVPLMMENQMILDAYIHTMLEAKPQVIILCGDNTNDGRVEDARALATALAPLKEAGIHLLIIPGNHDFNNMSKSEYESIFDPLVVADSQDQETLSYISKWQDIWFFCMDDSSAGDGVGGVFPTSTMTWLEQNLKSANQQGKRVIFISHHNVLMNLGVSNNENYQIQNSTLTSLLQANGVRLALTGHRHGQLIRKEGSFTEIVNPMMAMAPNTYGSITIENGQLTYTTQKIPVDEYLASQKIDDYQPEGFAAYAQTVTQERFEVVAKTILGDRDWTQEQKDGVEALFIRYYWDYYKACLGVSNEAQKIKEDPYYDFMMEAIKGTNYEVWMGWMLDHPSVSQPSITLPF